MTQFLPPNLLALFAARDPIPFLPPLTKLSHEKKTNGYEGVGKFLDQFEDPADTPPKAKVETREERKERKRREKAEQHAYKLEQEIAVWNPNEVDGGTSDPYKTLFVGRVNFDSSESKLKREFESYGPVKKITVVHNRKTGKPRGYAFVEYEHERDMRAAYKHADGKKIDGRRVLVDVERGRTVKGWLPRRLGGGLGGTRRGGPEVNVKISGREDSERDRNREKDVDRGRDRGDDRRDRRERDKSRERDDVSRHRDRDRDNRGDRRRSRDRGDRDRDRDRKRNRRSRSRDRKDKENPEEGEERAARKRSRSREKKRHRSRSKDKDRKKDKRDKERDRDKDRERKEKIKEDVDYSRVKIKEEPVDEGYSQYENPYQDFQGAFIKAEDENGDEEGRRTEDYDNYNGERERY